MSLTLAHVTTNPADAVVLVSELESGGFHPVLFDYHHSFMALGYLQALGGIRIMLPANEIEDAKAYLKLAEPIEDCPPLRDRPLKDIVYATILSVNPFFPLYLLSPIILALLAAIWIAVNAYFNLQPLWVSFLEYFSLIYIIGMLAHAKYVAVPKMRDSYEP